MPRTYGTKAGGESAEEPGAPGAGSRGSSVSVKRAAAMALTYGIGRAFNVADHAL